MARLNEQRAITNRRSADRKAVRVTADFRRTGRTPFRVHVRDLSASGCRCETVSKVYDGDVVWITIPGLAPISGTIRWVSTREFGVQWSHPLHISVLDHVAKQHPYMV